MRECWTLDAGWSYTVLGVSANDPAVSLHHDALPLPATLSAGENAGSLLLEKQIHISEEWAGKCFYLCVKGISHTVSVSLNGFLMGTLGLYDQSEIDLTAAMEIGATNTLTLSLPFTAGETFMVKAFSLLAVSPCHIAPGGIAYMAESKKEEGISLWLDCLTENHTAEVAHYRLVHTLYSEDGKKLTKATATLQIPPFSAQKDKTEIELPHVICWGEKAPITYTLETELYRKTELVDKVVTVCGIRPLKVDARRGILENNTPIKLHGIEDIPVPQNRMTPPSLLVGEAQVLLNSGINAVSLVYDVNTEDRLTIFDAIGISAVVTLPLKALFDRDCAKLLAVVKRLRTHPSLLLWSVGDLPFPSSDSRSILAVEKIAHLLRAEDPAHPLTAKVTPTTDSRIVKNLQLLTVFLDEDQGEALREAFPSKPIILQSEAEEAFLPAFHAISRSIYVGHFQQVSPTLFEQIPCESGILRLSMFAPRLMAQMRACYQKRIHVLDLQLGEATEEEQALTLLTNCDNTSLWVDGRPYGGTVKTVSPDRTVHIPLTFGYAEAVGFFEGKEVARAQIEPVGNPYALALSLAYAPEQQQKGDVLWVSCRVLDSEGREVPGVNTEVCFTLRGGACFDANPDLPKGEGFILPLVGGHGAVSLRRTEPQNPISLEVTSDIYVPTALLLK